MKGLLRQKTAFWRLQRLPGGQNLNIFQYSTGHAYAHKSAIKPPNTQDINLHTSRTRPAGQLPSCRHSNLQNCAGLKRQRLAFCMAQNRWAGMPKQNPPAKSPIYRQLGEGFGRRFARWFGQGLGKGFGKGPSRCFGRGLDRQPSIKGLRTIKIQQGLSQGFELFQRQGSHRQFLALAEFAAAAR